MLLHFLSCCNSSVPVSFRKLTWVNLQSQRLWQVDGIFDLSAMRRGADCNKQIAHLPPGPCWGTCVSSYFRAAPTSFPFSPRFLRALCCSAPWAGAVRMQHSSALAMEGGFQQKMEVTELQPVLIPSLPLLLSKLEISTIISLMGVLEHMRKSWRCKSPFPNQCCNF